MCTFVSVIETAAFVSEEPSVELPLVKLFASLGIGESPAMRRWPLPLVALTGVPLQSSVQQLWLNWALAIPIQRHNGVPEVSPGYSKFGQC